VVDRGIGIPPSQRQIVFERFERAIDTERQIKGLGLGLYIARRIIDAHGGTIGVESTPGEGSTFSFTVPILDGD
jgi:signal transduction histidine kinase